MLAIAHPAGHSVHDHSNRALGHTSSPNSGPLVTRKRFHRLFCEDSVETSRGAICPTRPDSATGPPEVLQSGLGPLGSVDTVRTFTVRCRKTLSRQRAKGCAMAINRRQF